MNRQHHVIAMGNIMGNTLRQGSPLFIGATTGQPVTREMPWVVGCLHKGKLLLATPDYSTIVETLTTLRIQYGGMFLVRRDEPLCEWRPSTDLVEDRVKYVIMIPTAGDPIQDLYDAKNIGYEAGYKNALRELGHVTGCPLLQ